MPNTLNDNLSERVGELLNDPASNNSSAEEPPDIAMSQFNTEVIDLMKESRNIQDELQQSEVVRKTIEANKLTSELKQAGALATSLDNIDTAPPHPLTTYCWEDIRRNKEKVSFLDNNRPSF